MGNIPTATKNLLIINVLLFFATQVIHSFNWSILGMFYWETSYFRPFQFITYMFMHANFGHIFFNMFALYTFGGVLEHFWGSKKFLLYYLFTGIGAALVQQLVWYLTNSGGKTVGASGAVFGLLIAYGWMFPNEKLMLIFLPIPIKAKYFVWIYSFMELTLGVANFRFDNIAHFAHLGGLFFGLILLIYWKKKGQLFL